MEEARHSPDRECFDYCQLDVGGGGWGEWHPAPRPAMGSSGGAPVASCAGRRGCRPPPPLTTHPTAPCLCRSAATGPATTDRSCASPWRRAPPLHFLYLPLYTRPVCQACCAAAVAGCRKNKSPTPPPFFGPLQVVHLIDADSPLIDWLHPGGMEADRDSEIVVLVRLGLRLRLSSCVRAWACAGGVGPQAWRDGLPLAAAGARWKTPLCARAGARSTPTS